MVPAEPYDASETDDRPKTSYISKRDWRILFIFAVLIAPIGFLLYRQALGNTQTHLCANNLAQIQKALGVYMESNNDRFPPVFVEDSNHEPMLFPVGSKTAPYSWVTLLQPGLETRASFVCPAASKEEIADNLHPSAPNAPLESSYGLYMPRSGWAASLIQSPESALAIAETSTNGSNNSYDPVPYSVGQDGIVIGWDTGNTALAVDSRYVTRLAFPNTANGRFPEVGAARHGSFIHGLTVAGKKKKLLPFHARIHRLGQQATGFWAER